MFELRHYQKKFIADVREKFRAGIRRVCGVMPCGAGKTLAVAEMTKDYAAEGKRVVFMVHRKELIEQTSKTFDELGIKHGIIASSVKPNYKLPVQIASVQTLDRRLEQILHPDFLIVDECHHIEASTYKRIVKSWRCLLLGITATPIRMGGRTLHDSFDALVIGPSVKMLIDYGYLAGFNYYAPPSTIDFRKLRLNAFGDFRDDDMINALDRRDIIGDIVKHYRKHAEGLQAIVYCINIHHSEHMSKAFNAAGIRAQHLDAKTHPLERQAIIKKFRAGEITVLCNVELFGEGFDVPNMDCVILARPTKSFTLYYQQAMRALRPNSIDPSKKAIILDHVGNNTRFAMPDDPIRWSLDPNALKGKGIAPTKTCPECGRDDLPTGARTCTEVISSNGSIAALELTKNTLSIVYKPHKPITRHGWLALVDCKTNLYLEFFENKSEIVSNKKVTRRCVAELVQASYDPKREVHRLSLKCLDESVELREAKISRANGASFETIVLCNAEGKVLKYFLDPNGSLICGHIFNVRNSEVDEEGIIVKVYESARSKKTSSPSKQTPHPKRASPPKQTPKPPLMTKLPTTIEEFLLFAQQKKMRDPARWASEQVLKQAESLQDCLHIAHVCGYSREWAIETWNAIKPKPKSSSSPKKPAYRWKETKTDGKQKKEIRPSQRRKSEKKGTDSPKEKTSKIKHAGLHSHVY